MRNRFIDLIHKEMSVNENIVFLTADMGINLVEKIQLDFPGRFHNVGIAEQNLVGIAAGLAENGFRPFAYTISNFLSIRALEQIRNDIVMHQLPVTLVGTSTGFDNGPLGATHHMLEDWGILSGMPNLNISCPCTPSGVDSLFIECLSSNFPSYIRIPKGQGIQDETSRIKNRKSLVISYGSASEYAINHAISNDYDYLLIEKLKPFLIDENLVANYQNIIVIEDHFATIGLYSKMCQFVNEKRVECHVTSIAPIGYDLHVQNRFEDFLRR